MKSDATTHPLQRREFLRLYSGLLLVTGISTLSSCGGGGGGGDKLSINIPQYPLIPSSRTVLLPSDGPVQVAEIGTDYVRLTGPVPTLSAGTILAGGGAKSILREVVSVEGSGSSVLVRTIPAGLMDAYTQGTVKVPMTFSREELGDLESDIPGVSFEWLDQGTRSRTEGPSTSLEVKLDALPLDPSGSVTVSGSTNLSCTPLIPELGWGDFYWRPNDTGGVDAGAFMGVTMNASATLTVASALALTVSKQIPISKKKILAPRFITPTLWVWPVVQVLLEIGVRIEDEVKATVSGNFEGNAAYHWTSANGGKPTLTWSKSANASINGATNYKATVSLPVLNISFIPYVPSDELVPETYFKVTPATLDFTGSCKEDQAGQTHGNMELLLEHQASIAAGIDFDFLGVKLATVELSRSTPKTEIWKGDGEPCPTPTPEPTPTPKPTPTPEPTPAPDPNIYVLRVSVSLHREPVLVALNGETLGGGSEAIWVEKVFDYKYDQTYTFTVTNTGNDTTGFNGQAFVNIRHSDGSLGGLVATVVLYSSGIPPGYVATYTM